MIISEVLHVKGVFAEVMLLLLHETEHHHHLTAVSVSSSSSPADMKMVLVSVLYFCFSIGGWFVTSELTAAGAH